MAQIILRRLSSQNPKPSSLFSSHGFLYRTFSTSQPTLSDPQTPKPSNLSARLSFVFDQIDQIEKDRSEKDQTLQRIRSWRQSKNIENTIQKDTQNPESEIGYENGVKSEPVELKLGGESKLEAELVHPWPEWIELMERLVQQNYFDHRRRDEDQMVQQLGFDVSGVKDAVGIDFRDFKTVQTACLNFGKDRFDILRSLSRQDIQILVGYGCPSADKKVVFSAKLLRKHVHLDEGDVCSSCSLRSSCERAYLLTEKETEAQTIDVMRVLLTFGFDPVNGSVVNKSLLKQKSVKTVTRKLLHEVVKLSAVPIDPNLPPPVIKRPPPKVKQPPPPPKKRVGRDDIEMKKGDWLCPKCDFMNFAKNTVCLQCDAKRPKRQLLPGEWECPECNFLNYRRNMACFHCECKRPADEFVESKIQERQHGHRTRLEKTASRAEVSNAWNFDFDDNESDGADVAAFEYADSSVRGEDLPLDSQAQGNYRVSEDDFSEARRVPRANEREYSSASKKPGMGFDDFDDEDDVDSYELDHQNSNSVQKTSLNDFSDIEGYSEHEIDGSNDNSLARRTSTPSYNKPYKPMRQQAAFSEDDELDFDTDEELPVHPDWKSSHVADSRHRSRGRGPTGSPRRLSFGSDEEPGLHSDVDDDLDEDLGSRKSKGNKLGSGRRDHQRRDFSGSESESDDLCSHRNRIGGNRVEASRGGKFSKSPGRRDYQRRGFSGSESESDDVRTHRNKTRGNRVEASRGGKISRSPGNYKFTRDTNSRSRPMTSDRRNSFNDDFNSRSSRGSGGNNRGFRGGDNVGRRMNSRGGDLQKFKAPRGEGYGNRQGGRFNDYDRGMDGDSGEFRNSRRVIER